MITVAQLIESLKKCPQGMEIQLYYDGAPRLVPDFAFMAKKYGKGSDLVILGEAGDIYNLDDESNWGGKPVVLFDNSERPLQEANLFTCTNPLEKPVHDHPQSYSTQCPACVPKMSDYSLRGVPTDSIRERIWAEAYIACISAGGMMQQLAESTADIALEKFDSRFRAALETIATPMQQHDGFTCHSLKPRN